jgi:hypothetical protein
VYGAAGVNVWADRFRRNSLWRGARNSADGRVLRRHVHLQLQLQLPPQLQLLQRRVHRGKGEARRSAAWREGASIHEPGRTAFWRLPLGRASGGVRSGGSDQSSFSARCMTSISRHRVRHAAMCFFRVPLCSNRMRRCVPSVFGARVPHLMPTASQPHFHLFQPCSALRIRPRWAC